MSIAARRRTKSNSYSTIYLTPATKSAGVGNSVTLQLRINARQTVNAVKCTISFPASALSLTGFDATGSPFDIALAQSQASGTLSIERGTYAPINSDSLIGTLTFTVQSTTSATITLTDANSLYDGEWYNPQVNNAIVN